MVTFASICSGIEAASAAWEPLGWRCLWLAEIDKAASGVLAYRYPHIPNLGDLITLPARMAAGEMPPPDILIGGTPCQAFSIAGLRGGMDDPRGALTMAFVRLADAIDERRRAMGLPPVIIVWENVPGVLNHKDNPFGCFLAALAGEDMPLVASGKRWTNAGLVSGPQRTIGWRILDAQYFGLAQRRRRLFVVASAGARFDPGTILFESQGVRRDIAPCRETGESFTHPVAGSLTSSGRGERRPGDTRGQDPIVAVSPTLRAGANSTGGDRPPGTDVDTADSLIVHCFDARQSDVLQYGAITGPVDTDGYSQAICFDTTQITHPANRSNPKPGDICHPLAAGGHPPAICFSSKDHGGDAMTDCAPTLEASGHVNSHSNAGAPPAVCVTGSVTHCLKAEGFDASEDGTGRGHPITTFSIMPMNSGRDYVARPTDIAQPPIAAGQAGGNQGGDYLVSRLSVRRLLPVECERLHGFPDGWTERGTKTQADGPRYKQLGNSMPVPVIRWLGQRIEACL